LLSDYCDAEGLKLSESIAYADSSSDLPMLEAVGFPVAVNPETRLAALARKRGWLVEHWSKADGAPRKTLPIGERVDAVAYDPDSKMIFASNWDGTVSVIHQESADKYTSVGDIATQKSAKTMTLDPKTKRLFLSAAEMEAAPVENGQRPRMRPKPGTFNVLVIESTKAE
jgi:DNA-binding beta-propeller fold protein YncE